MYKSTQLLLIYFRNFKAKKKTHSNNGIKSALNTSYGRNGLSVCQFQFYRLKRERYFINNTATRARFSRFFRHVLLFIARVSNNAHPAFITRKLYCIRF